MSSTLTPLSIMLRLQIMYNFCWVRMVSAFKTTLNPYLKSSKLINHSLFHKQYLCKHENILLFVTYFLSYLLIRVTSAEQLMINAAFKLKAHTENSQMLTRRATLIMLFLVYILWLGNLSMMVSCEEMNESML